LEGQLDSKPQALDFVRQLTLSHPKLTGK